VCPQIIVRVPRAEIDFAVANPNAIDGYDQLERPGKPAGPYNRRRVWLSMRNLAVPYNPVFNGLTYRAGCP
jgi:hypothetical protein